MLITDQYLYNKSIMVGILGVPNVGKSSLINHLLGFDLTIVTNKPQTTRNQFHCTFTVDHTEIILVDTPGIHRSSKEINLRMNEQAKEGTEGTDINLLLIDINGDWESQYNEVKAVFEKSHLGQKISDWKNTWLVFTKSDLVAEEQLETIMKPLVENFFKQKQKENPSLQHFFLLSAKSGQNVHELIGKICDAAPSAPHLYPGGDVSNKNERFFVTEYIREQAFKILKDELPYEIAVVIDEYRDLKPFEQQELSEEEINHEHTENKRKGKLVSYISASILVNRPSQRAIVVGSKGGVIKEIGVKSRKKIEALLGGPVHLNLHVKVSPKWDKNNYVLEEIGLKRAPTSSRVWRMRTDQHSQQ